MTFKYNLVIHIYVPFTFEAHPMAKATIIAEL